MSLKLVIFDVDGLLLDTERVWQEVWRDIADSYSLGNIGNSIFMKVVGLSGPIVHQILEDDLNGLCSSEEFLEKSRKEGLRRLETQLEVKSGAIDLLEFLKSHDIPCAVATSTSRDLTNERLKRVGLYDYFQYICCGDEIEHKKPSPDIYLKILNKMNIEAENALVFEDSPIGIEAAIKANIPCVMVPDLIEPKESQKNKVLKIIKSLEFARPIIKNIMVG